MSISSTPESYVQAYSARPKRVIDSIPPCGHSYPAPNPEYVPKTLHQTLKASNPAVSRLSKKRRDCAVEEKGVITLQNGFQPDGAAHRKRKPPVH